MSDQAGEYLIAFYQELQSKNRTLIYELKHLEYELNRLEVRIKRLEEIESFIPGGKPPGKIDLDEARKGEFPVK